MNAELNNLRIIDIETVSISSSFEIPIENLRQHWERKAIQLCSEDEKLTSDLYFGRRTIYDELEKIIIISVGISYEFEGETLLNITFFQNCDEAKLLNGFKKLFGIKFNRQQLKLCIHNGKEFYFPFLCWCMIVNGGVIPQTLDLSGKKPWEVQHVSTDLWKFGDKKNYTPLDLLAPLFYIDSSKLNIDGSQVNKVYYNENTDSKQLMNYCQGVVIGIDQVYLN